MTPREQWAAVRKLDGDTRLQIGPNTSNRFLGDPKRLSFMLARYSFAAKMFHDKETILDIGCGSGEGTLSLLRENPYAYVTGIDFDEALIQHAKDYLLPEADAGDRLDFYNHDFLEREPKLWEAICSIDCIEHINPSKSDEFLVGIRRSLRPNGLAVIGTPNAYAAHLGSVHSQTGHINNLKPGELSDGLFRAGFSHVFLFGMNDCTLHTGHPQLWHYILALAVKS